MNNQQLFYLLGKCLSLSRHPENREVIINSFRHPDMPWQSFIGLASNHLIIPSLFVQLRNNELLQELPSQLTEQIHHIHQLNYERNQETIQQLLEINSLLSVEKITPIYLKGTGNLIDGLYDDLGERIFGDIDFLVGEDEFVRTAEILKKNGYRHSDPFYADSVCRYKHFPRLYKQGVPVDVEIHQRPVEFGYKYFNYGQINPKKKRAKLYPDCYVMSDEHKLIMNFYHGYKASDVQTHITYRNLYDFNLLSLRVNALKTLSDFGHYKQQTGIYIHFAFQALSLNNQPIKRNWRDDLFTHFYHLQMRDKIVYKATSFIHQQITLTISRTKTLCNKRTRRPAIKYYLRRVFLQPLTNLRDKHKFPVNAEI